MIAWFHNGRNKSLDYDVSQDFTVVHTVSLGMMLRKHWKQLLVMTMLSFGLRIIMYETYMVNHVLQTDSLEYLALAHGWLKTNVPGISLDGRPDFWRTPGYPWFLMTMLKVHRWAQPAAQVFQGIHMALWVQMVLCSLLPLLVVMLGFILYPCVSYALCLGWIATLHLGYLLTSMHVHTDGIALIFLLPFFICLFAWVDRRCEYVYSTNIVVPIASAALLGVYTLIRPMGLFVAQLCTVLMLANGWPWREKIKRVLLFWLVFMLCIGGWYVRNHNYTGQWFYNPTLGKTLFFFSLPKILMHTTGCSWDDSFKKVIGEGIQREEEAIKKLVAEGKSPYSFVREYTMGDIAMPIVRQHLGWFVYDWIVQIIKAMFDGYTPMLVDCVQHIEDRDTAEETLIGKMSEALYSYPIPPWMRALAWLELCFMVVVWIGFFAGTAVFLGIPLFNRTLLQQHGYHDRMVWLWLKVGMVIGGCLLMTGANGYARLRLPIDILIIALSLTFWWWFFGRAQEHENTLVGHGKIDDVPR